MNEDDYGRWMDELVVEGVYTEELAEDFKMQRRLFEAEFRSRMNEWGDRPPGALGFVAGNALASETAQSLVAGAVAEYPGRAIYFESFGTGLG